MYVERVLSLNDGWSILNTQKHEEWAEALGIFQLFDDETVINAFHDVSKSGSSLDFLNIYMYTMYRRMLIVEAGWNQSPPQGLIQNSSYYKEIPVKNGVLASVMGMDDVSGGDIANNLFLNTPLYFHAGVVDVGVFFIPTAASIANFVKHGASSDISPSLPTEEFCRQEIAKFKALTSQAPMVLAFFSPTAPEEIAVEEVTPLKVGGHTIERTLEFAPEYYQASVGLLSYFGKVLREKDPQTKAKVRIEQDGNTVRLRIESPSGDIETIEERLEQYALIINQQAPPESLLDNPGQIVELKAQLRVAQMQVETAHDLKQLSDGRITSLEKQVEFLQTQFAAQILQTDKVIDIVGRQNDSHERLQTALLTHSGVLFKDLLKEASGNQQLLEAVGNLHQNLLAGITTIEIEDQLERALATIKEAKPSFLGRIFKELEGAAYKSAAGSSISWVVDWITKHKA